MAHLALLVLAVAALAVAASYTSRQVTSANGRHFEPEVERR